MSSALRLVDSHAHLDDEKFDEDRQEMLERAIKAGMSAIICPACSPSSLKPIEKLVTENSMLYGAAGIHPHDASDYTGEVEDKILELLENENFVALGEIGLDYHYDFSPRDLQKRVFERQLEMARDTSAPIIVHVREAHGDAVEMLKRFAPLTGVMHCFSGGVELADQYIGMGLHIGIGGALTFKNARKPVEVVNHIPLDRLLVETDAPYMAPVPLRGKRNEPAFVQKVVEKIAEIRSITIEDAANITADNANRLFGIAS